MNGQRLEILRDLAARGSVTAVAKARRVTPTAISQQLKALEREAGSELVRRVGRGVALTEAGHFLARASMNIAVAQERLDREWQEYRGEVRGDVSLAMFPSGAQLLLPGVLRRISRYPGLRLHAVDIDVPTSEFASHTQTCDIVLAHGEEHEDAWELADCGAEPLLDEPLDVGLAPHHPLASRRHIHITDVVEAPWIGVPRGWPFDRVLTGWFATARARPQVIQRFESIRVHEALVASGVGLALLPRFAAEDRAAGRLALRPIADYPAARTIVALQRHDRAERAAVRAVMGALRTAARDLTLTPPPPPPPTGGATRLWP